MHILINSFVIFTHIGTVKWKELIVDVEPVVTSRFLLFNFCLRFVQESPIDTKYVWERETADTEGLIWTKAWGSFVKKKIYQEYLISKTNSKIKKDTSQNERLRKAETKRKNDAQNNQGAFEAGGRHDKGSH